MVEISQQDIEGAHERIKPFIHQTPVLTSKAINEITSAEIYFKCENFQKAGAFKMRGATNAILSLTEEEKAKGVTTHSSGNHAQALALAAKLNGIKATIVMPKNAPAIKKKGVIGYGAEVITCEPTLKDREKGAEAVVKETGATFIPPYNDEKIIAGQATAAKELLDEISGLDAIFTPVGGGGLLSGTALAAKCFANNIKVYAGEPEQANDAYQSFKAGKLIPVNQPNTIADGLRTSLGDKTFSIIHSYVTDIFTVSEKEIVAAMQLIWERMKIIVEPSSAVPLAAIIKHKKEFANQKVGVIVSGGNVDLSQLPF